MTYKLTLTNGERIGIKSQHLGIEKFMKCTAISLTPGPNPVYGIPTDDPKCPDIILLSAIVKIEMWR